MKLPRLISALGRRYGPPKPPRVTEPFQMVLYEVVAYLVDDGRRDRAWAAFKKVVDAKTQPEAVLEADEQELLSAIRAGGLFPELRVQKLRKAARLCVDSIDGDLAALLKGPLKKARSGLRKFPGIGEPGADKILLYNRVAPGLALDSNALRVLLRLGFGTSEGGYAAQYRSVQDAVAELIKPDYDWLIAASQLLRLHGQSLCTRSRPACERCPLAKGCPSAGLV